MLESLEKGCLTLFSLKLQLFADHNVHTTIDRPAIDRTYI